MKLKSILFAISISICYHFLTVYWERNSYTIYSDQGQWQNNAIKAQNFLYNYEPSRYNCIVGTSLGFEIIQDSLPKNFYNLCFRGQSVMDGLAILKYKKKNPDTLFIETNYISKDITKEFVQRIAPNHVEVHLKSQVVMLLEKYMPLGVISQLIYEKTAFAWYYYNLAITSAFHIKEDNGNFQNIKKPDNILNKTLISDSLAMSQIPETSKLSQNFAKIQEQLINLEKRGVKVLFFEMPVHCKLANTLLPVMNLHEMQKKFPKEKYQYIHNGGCGNFETTDGKHLDRKSAERYTAYFLKEIAKGTAK